MLPCLVVFVTIGYAQMTDTQKEHYWGVIEWGPNAETDEGLPVIDGDGYIRAVEAVSDTYGRWYHYIIGAASCSVAAGVGNTTMIYTRAANVAGFSKMTIQVYSPTVVDGDSIDDATPDAMVTTGMAPFGYLPYGTVYPAARLGDVTPQIAAALPIGPYIAGATIAVASSPAGVDNTYNQSVNQRPIRSPDSPIMWNGITQWDIAGVASVIIEVSPLVSSLTGQPTGVILLRVSR